MTGEDIIIVIDERTLEPVVIPGGEYYRGPAGADGHTPYIGENGNWWINGEDTGKNAIAPTMSVIEQYVTGYAEPKRGIDDFFVSAAQVILINDIVNKVTAITGHSLVADTEIAKIHSRNTDSTLLSENGLHSVYIDANGTFHVKDISQIGTTYETHAEQLFTTKNEIILRDGAIAGLGVGEMAGFRFKKYDGISDGLLVVDKDGWARVGDVGALQKLATIEESPTNGYLMKYNSSTFRLESIDPLLLPVSTATQTALDLKGNLATANTWAQKQTFTLGAILTKIIPNSDTTGVVIRNAADNADVAFFDTNNKRAGFGTSNPVKKMSIEVPTNANTTDEAYSFQANFAGRYYTIAKISAREQNQYNGDLIFYTQPNQAPSAGLIDNTVERMRILANGNVRVGDNNGVAETKLDVNGTTTLRDWVYLNNGTHTGDAVGDYRSKTINNVKVIEVCTVLNTTTKGGGTWKRASGTSDLGGYMISLTNKTGAASVKGSVVSLSAATPSAFVLQSNEFDAVGIVYEAGVSDGAECWVVVSGIAEVLLEDNTASTMGNWVISSAVDGRANATQPTPTPNSTINEHTTHFKEIGHCMETKVAGTSVLTKCVIHFN